MTIPVKILHLEDNEQDAELINRYLVLTGIKFELLRVANKSDFVAALKDFLPELILSNQLSPEINSSEALKICKEKKCSAPFILISKVVSDEYGASIIKNEGAYDYVLKSHLQRLPSVINRALANNKLLIENKNCLDENTEIIVLLKDTERMAHLGSWQADLNAKTTIWSDEAYRLFGYEPGEIEASLDLFLNHIHPEDLEFVKKMTANAMIATNNSIGFTFRIIDKNRNNRYLLNKILVKRDKTGNPVRLTGFNLDITETVEVTKQLEKRERLYKKLIEKSTDMKMIRSPEGIILYVSPSFSQVFELDMDELIGKDITKMIHPDDLVKYHELNKDLLKNPGKSYNIEKRMMRSDGSYRWCEGTVTNWNDDEDIEGFVGNFRDVTEKKEDEIRISESEKRYQELFDNSPIPTWIYDSDSYQFLKVNKAAIRNYGYTLEEFMSMKAMDLKSKKDLDFFINASKIPGLYQTIHIKKDRKIINVELNSEQIIFEGKKANLVLSNDITERIKAEDALKKSESNLQTIFDNTDIGYILLDTELNVVSFNQVINIWTATALGQNLTIGLNLGKFIQNIKKEGIDLLRKLKQNNKGEKIDYESTFLDNQGKLTWYHVKYFPVLNDKGIDTGSILSLNDITSKKLAETEREEVTKDLIHRNKDLEQFAYIVSHNLRAPVANILGACSLMKDEGLEDADKDLLLVGLDSSIHNLDGVINDLNEILQTKKTMSETRQPVVFSELVAEIKSEIGDMIRNQNVEIKTDFSDIDEMLTLKSYIRSIFLNLITNSIKYKRPDLALVIHISSHRSPNDIKLIFKDNGLGIDMVKHKDQIFGLYKRFHVKVEGKGMGLYMVKTHVETLGGTIQLKSNVNEGCEFVIDFKI